MPEGEESLRPAIKGYRALAVSPDDKLIRSVFKKIFESLDYVKIP